MARVSKSTPLHEMAATAAARRIQKGELKAESYVRACLERIEERENTVKAWASIDAKRAIKYARALDRGTRRGVLHGIPIAVKDVIDTFDQPTEMGSSIYAGYQPAQDAASVALVRRQGAVILGKSVTCEFAGMHPGKTTNPHNSRHTPGGSSSGTAAAVADFMVPLGYGTQTGGSVIRPAAFCGIVGFKPTYGTINRAGIKFAAEALDTIGFMARHVDDVRLMLDAHIGKPRGRGGVSANPRVGICRTYHWHDKASEETRAAVDEAARIIEAAGALIADFGLPAGFESITPMRNVIDNVERAHGMADEWSRHRNKLSKELAGRIALGLKTSVSDYREAKRFLDRCRPQFDVAMAEFDVLLAPAVSGEAPAGFKSTGDTSFQSLWTALHVPAITLPCGVGPNGLPVGIQLIAPRWQDDRLLALAKWVERLI